MATAFTTHLAATMLEWLLIDKGGCEVRHIERTGLDGSARRTLFWRIIAICLWTTAAVTVLIYGGYLASLLQTVAGLIAWRQTEAAAVAGEDRTLSLRVRMAAIAGLFLVSLGEYPAKQGVAPVTAHLGAAPAKDRYAALTPVERKAIEQADYYRAHPGQAAELTKMKWRKKGFGNVMIADLTIHNRSPFDLKDFVITCTVRGKSGTEIGVPEQTLFEIVQANKTRSFRGINMGLIDSQTARANCQIFDASLA